MFLSCFLLLTHTLHRIKMIRSRKTEQGEIYLEFFNLFNFFNDDYVAHLKQSIICASVLFAFVTSPLFTKLSRSGDNEGTFWSLSEAMSPAYLSTTHLVLYEFCIKHNSLLFIKHSNDSILSRRMQRPGDSKRLIQSCKSSYRV